MNVTGTLYKIEAIQWKPHMGGVKVINIAFYINAVMSITETFNIIKKWFPSSLKVIRFAVQKTSGKVQRYSTIVLCHPDNEAVLSVIQRDRIVFRVQNVRTLHSLF